MAAAQQPEIATTVAFTEGPTVDRAGNVYFTEIINQRIMKLGADGVLSTYREKSNAANGLLLDPQGRLIACEGGPVRTARRQGAGHAACHPHRYADGQDRRHRRRLRGQALPGAERHHHRQQGTAVLHRPRRRRGLPHRHLGRGRADSCRARRAASQRHSGLARRHEAVPDRSQSGAGRRAADPRLRSAAGWDGAEHARPLQFFPGPQRRRHEHRYPGEPVRLGRHEPAARQLPRRSTPRPAST